MKKIIKNHKNNPLNKFTYLGVIPGILILFWVMGSILLNAKTNSNVLIYAQNDSKIDIVSEGLLLKGNKISGEFKARDNYLNFIQFKFDEYAKHDFAGDDVLAFRIKPVDEADWSYTSSYKTEVLENDLLFPFEFPRINNSKDVRYQFEIESMLGTNTNGVEIRKNSAEVYSGYNYPLSEITKTNATALEFISKKVVTSFTNTDFFLGSLIYLIPFLGYITLHANLFSKNIVNNKKYIVTVLVIILLYIDVFQIKQTYLGLLFILILGWILLVAINKYGSRASFILAFSLIILWNLLLLFKINDFQNKINLWTYAFLGIGLFHTVLEERKRQSLKARSNI